MGQIDSCCRPSEVQALGVPPAPSPLPDSCCAPSPCSASSAPVTARLTALRAGQEATICECALEPRDAAVLRAMGLKQSARIRVCRTGEPFVIEVLYHGSGCSFRIGLARPLAGRVTVADPTSA